MDYQKQAQDFLDKTGTTFQAVYDRHEGYSPGDREKRDVYNITLRRGEKEYTFPFGQSLVRSKGWIERDRPALNLLRFYTRPISLPGRWMCKGIPPTPYDVLSTITKYNPGLFEEFCMDFGYDLDSRRAKKIYHAVMDDYLHLSKMFGPEELEEMNEIQ